MWEHRLLGHAAPQTTDGRLIEVIDPGRRNVDAGPDFFNAKVRIGDRVWAGNVEMHLRSSDWLTHRHNENRAYDSVILHVVTEADTEGGHGQTGHVLVRPQGNGQETVQQSHQQGTQQTAKHRNRNSEESVHICRTACRSLIEEGADDTADTSHIHNAGDSQIQVTGFLRDDLTGTSV